MDGKLEDLLELWSMVRLSMFRSSEAAIKITHDKSNKDFEGGELGERTDGKINGIFVELMLKFPEPLPQEFTEEEIKELERFKEALYSERE